MKKENMKKDNLLITVLTQEPTSFPRETKTLIDEANKSEKPFGEKLDDASRKVNGYRIGALRKLEKVA